MKTSSRICLILLRNEPIVRFQMHQLALRSVISHQSMFVISCLYNMQQDPVAGAGGGCHQGRNVGDFMGLAESTSSSPTHKSNGIMVSARGPDLRGPFHSWQDSRSADIVYFFICAESIRQVIIKYHINTCGNHSLIIFQGSCLENSDELQWNIKQTLVVHFHDLLYL